MTHHDREVERVLDTLDSVLVRAIKGVFWFPLVFLPRFILGGFPLVLKLIRVVALFVVWAVFVFGPLPLIADVREPVFGLAIVCWTLLALLGSAVGVLKLRKSTPAIPRPAKPADYAEAFV